MATKEEIAAARKKLGKSFDQALERVRISTPESEAARVANLKTLVGAALRDPNANRDTVAAALEAASTDRMESFTTDQKAKFLATIPIVADQLMKTKEEQGAEKAVEVFNTATDRAQSGDAGSLPLAGMALGGGAGLAAASVLDVGDWSSFSGIMKKMAVITAGVVLGGITESALAKRDENVIAQSDDGTVKVQLLPASNKAEQAR